MRASVIFLFSLAACATEAFDASSIEAPELDEAEQDRRAVHLTLQVSPVVFGGAGTVRLAGGAPGRGARLAIAPPWNLTCNPVTDCLNLALTDSAGAPCVTNARGAATCYLPWPYGIEPGSIARAWQPGVRRSISNAVDLVVPWCGDGVLDASEQCDDGNTWDYDGCSAYCQIEYAQCGNGQLEYGEECDDGNPYDGDGCSSDCRWSYYAYCGNGVLEPYEACDDGNYNNYDGCDQYCGLEYGYCGDGYLQAGEDCDDANNNDGDGCSADCHWGPYWFCGNGILEGTEQCDDGNMAYYDGCDPYCNVE